MLCEVCHKNFWSHRIKYKDGFVFICRECYLEWLRIYESHPKELHNTYGVKFRKNFDFYFGKFMKDKKKEHKEQVKIILT